MAAWSSAEEARRYVGDGVATTNLAGRVLRNPWLGVNAGLQAAAAADLEERLTNKPSRVSAALEKLAGAH